MPYFHDLALKHRTDFSATLVKDIYSVLDQTANPSGTPASKDRKLDPSFGAFVHYGTVELMDKLDTLPNGALSDEKVEFIREKWAESGAFFARAVIAYTFHIVVRELRHGNTKYLKGADTLSAFGPKVYSVLESIIKSGQDYMDTLLAHEHSASVSIGDFLMAVRDQYNDGGWGGSFGGKKWGTITDVLVALVHGSMSPLMAADRIWTLQHNTCSIFNKPVFFKNYSDDLHHVLEAQAASSVFTLSHRFKSPDTYHKPIMGAFDELREAAFEALGAYAPDLVPVIEAPKEGSVGKSKTWPFQIGAMQITLGRDAA